LGVAGPFIPLKAGTPDDGGLIHRWRVRDEPQQPRAAYLDPASLSDSAFAFGEPFCIGLAVDSYPIQTTVSCRVRVDRAYMPRWLRARSPSRPTTSFP
jgi:hypothetical protein